MIVRCPLCHREIRWEGNPSRPFCSERCQVADLGAWASERYRMPGQDLAIPPESSSDSESES
ncbi:MAG: DNA gyrase inhibitor YacG [Nitrospirales bacterium]